METERELKSWLNEDEKENLAASIRKLRDELIEKVSEGYGLSADDKKAIFEKARTNISGGKS